MKTCIIDDNVKILNQMLLWEKMYIYILMLLYGEIEMSK